MDIKTVREFENSLVPMRSIAQARLNLERAEAELPNGTDDRYRAAFRHGFDAGWDAAMSEVRKILLQMQGEALKEVYRKEAK